MYGIVSYDFLQGIWVLQDMTITWMGLKIAITGSERGLCPEIESTSVDSL